MAHYNTLPLTPRELWQYAVKHGLADERIRICDGAAISYFPTNETLCRSKNKVIIDVSCEQPVEFDELAADDRTIVYRHQGYEYHCPPLPINNEL